MSQGEPNKVAPFSQNSKVECWVARTTRGTGARDSGVPDANELGDIYNTWQRFTLVSYKTWRRFTGLTLFHVAPGSSFTTHISFISSFIEAILRYNTVLQQFKLPEIKTLLFFVY